MPDYKEMYLTMVRATEQAIETLISAQRTCEEMYLNQPDPALRVLPLAAREKESSDKQ